MWRFAPLCIFAKPNELLASMAGRIAIGTSAGRKPLTLYGVPPLEKASNSSLLASVGVLTVRSDGL